jgi:alkanesulfonate monooxygenase SsuD/methylene tetrahydromethanopterin reductase-like flavin-dependent oxidoreductase (luciferase family)
MPLPAKPLSRLGFLTIGLFDGADPRPGHESTLEIIQLGEQLGFDSAWVRHPSSAIRDLLPGRVQRLLRFVRGEAVTEFSGVEGIEVFSDRVQPHSPGLAGRMWYGGASLRSAQWAGENGMNLLASSVVKAEESLVVIPTDSASPGQRAKYLQYAQSPCR